MVKKMETKSRYEVISELEKEKRNLLKQKDTLNDELFEKEKYIEQVQINKRNNLTAIERNKTDLTKQKEQMIDDGAYGGKEVNASMFIFLLKVNHGMIETEKKMLVGGDGQELKIRVIAEKHDGDRFSDQELPKTTADI